MDRKLLYRFFRGESTPEEEYLILGWLESGQENRDMFDAEREIYNAVTIHSPGILDSEDRVDGRKLPLVRTVRYAAGIAAVAALMVTAGLFVLNGLRDEPPVRTMAIYVPAGQRINVTLADGTTVWLNAETRMEYPVTFGSERRVKLEGEALFDVAHDHRSPFIVETFACDVMVSGTRFNVDAESKSGIFTVALLEGGVRVLNKMAGNESVTLEPDERASLVSGHLLLDVIEDRSEYRWTEGLMNIGNITFGQLLEKFEKYYGVRIVAERDELPEHVGYKGKLRVTDGIDHALNILQRTSSFTYVRDETTNTIYIK